MGYPAALTAKIWGFQDVLFGGQPIKLPEQGFGSYVMEHVLFKISFPAEFHAQTAVEAAVALHPQVKDRLDEIDRVVIETQESGKRIIDKTGPLDNPADRDHCLQYMVAVAADQRHADRRRLRGRRRRRPADRRAAREDGRRGERRASRTDYLDPAKRSIANAVQVFFERRHVHRARRGRVPHRPPPAPAGRHSAAAGEVRAERAQRRCPARTRTG